MVSGDHVGDGSLLVGDWVPVSWTSTAAAEARARPALGLRELLEHAHEVASLDVTVPPALSGLYRVLYALAARVTRLDVAPDGAHAWLDRREDVLAAGLFDAEDIESYFARYPGRFDLFDPERPFLQDPRLSKQCPKAAGVNKLVAGRPAGNNHSWFGGHHQDSTPIPVPPAQAFFDLLVWLYYGASGRCASRTVGSESKADTKAGPLRSTLSYHPAGATLFETLIAGLPRPTDEPSSADDRCAWELDELPDSTKAPTAVRGVGSLLTGRAQHAVLLVPNENRTAVVDAYITWAYREAVPSGEDPYLIWQTSKQGNLYARRADANRALWRDLDALIMERPTGSEQVHRPAVFADPPDLSGLRVQSLGFEQDGQAKDTQLVSGLTPEVFDLIEARTPQLRPRIGDLRQAAETLGNRLERAAKKAWAELTGGKLADCAWSREALARYWPLAEDEFWLRLADRRFDHLTRAFRRIAEPIYDEVTKEAAASQRGARAVELARFELYGGRSGTTNPRSTS